MPVVNVAGRGRRLRRRGNGDGRWRRWLRSDRRSAGHRQSRTAAAAAEWLLIGRSRWRTNSGTFFENAPQRLNVGGELGPAPRTVGTRRSVRNIQIFRSQVPESLIPKTRARKPFTNLPLQLLRNGQLVVAAVRRARGFRTTAALRRRW